MSFYTEIQFAPDRLILKSFNEKVSGKPVLLEETAVPIINSGKILGELAKRIPNRIRIVLEPEELVFKNIKTPISDEKVLLQAIPFESRKYFKINTSEFIFTHQIWKKETEGYQLTLLGVSRTRLEKYSPLIQAGFFLSISIKDYSSMEKVPFFHLIKMDPAKESIRLYANGSLISWYVYGKADRKESCC